MGRREHASDWRLEEREGAKAGGGCSSCRGIGGPGLATTGVDLRAVKVERREEFDRSREILAQELGEDEGSVRVS